MKEIRGLNYCGILIFIGCCLCLNVVSAGKCFKDEAIGDRDGNVYYCNDPSKPECCEEDNAFTCCEEQAKKSLREQLILWGSVGGMVLLISLVCCYFWRDGDCCKGDRTLKEKMCSCCRKSSVDDKAKLTDIPEAGPSGNQRFSTKPWYIRNQYDENGGINSPIPEFNFKKPSR